MVVLDRGDLTPLRDRSIALVMGGYINSLGMIRSLGEGDGVTVVALCPAGSSAAASRFCDYAVTCDTDEERASALVALDRTCRSVVPYPATDLHFALLLELRSELSSTSVPFTDERVLDKDHQLRVANEQGIPLPETVTIEAGNIDVTGLPRCDVWMVKPSHSIGSRLFKAVVTGDAGRVEALARRCAEFGIDTIVARYVDGDDGDLYTFGGYARAGAVIAPFVGRKLAQRPHLRGLASVATLADAAEVAELGARFIAATAYTGEFQVEFKRDRQDGRYYFIEFNPRNWFWSRLAVLTGNNFHLTKYRAETSAATVAPESSAPSSAAALFFSGEHVLYNLIAERRFGPLRLVVASLFSRARTVPSIFDVRDPLPFANSLWRILLALLGRGGGVR